MNTRDIINPIANASSLVAVPRRLSQAATAGVLALGLLRRRRRREPPVFAIAVGAALAAAAAVALLNPSSRNSIRSLLSRTGGGIGKQLGKFIGEHAGAHPRQTAELLQKTRELVGSDERATS